MYATLAVVVNQPSRPTPLKADAPLNLPTMRVQHLSLRKTVTRRCVAHVVHEAGASHAPPAQVFIKTDPVLEQRGEVRDVAREPVRMKVLFSNASTSAASRPFGSRGSVVGIHQPISKLISAQP